MMGLRALAALCLLVAPALADGPTDAQKQQAGALVKKAIAKSQAGDHAAAIELYREAYDIVPNALLLSNIGSEYKLDGKPVEALKYFCMYLEKDATGTNASYATAQATELTEQLELEGKPCAKPEPKKPPPPPDPVLEDKRPPPPPPAPEQPANPGGTLRMVGLGTTVVGLAVLGAGVYFGMKAGENSDLISNHPAGEPWPDNIKQIEADGQKYEDRQILFSIAGGAVAATGVVLYFVGRSKRAESPSKVTVIPKASPTSFGLALTGGF